MAEKTSTTAPEPSRVETGIARDRSISSEVGSKSAAERSTEGTTVDLNKDSISARTGLGDDLADDLDEPAAGDAEGPEGEGEKTPEEGDLGDWDPNSEEVRDKFDAKYFTAENGLNEAALSEEFWKNRAKDPKAGLNPATYAYLKDTLGISEEFARQVEEGLVAKAEKSDQAFFERVGGKDRYDAALKWGREGGYTKAQADRFNALRAKGGEDFLDAVDALMARYEKANGNKAVRRGPPGARRPSTPQRDVAGSAQAGASASPGYKDYKEYQTEMRTAQASGDKAKQDAVRQKLKRSSFYKA